MATTTRGYVSAVQWGCLVLLLAAIIAVAGFGAWLLTKPPVSPAGPRPTAIVWTATPTVAPSPTPTPKPTPARQAGELGVGSRVQVSGTGGVGLSIRAEASTTAERLEVAAEGEVFLVVAGPLEADNLVWWRVQDEARSEREGWAAAIYLTVLEQ